MIRGCVNLLMPHWCCLYPDEQNFEGICRYFQQRVLLTTHHSLQNRKNTCITPSLVCNMNTINNKKILLCTFTENVNCVAFTEFQILWALYIVVIQCHHLIENGPVGQRVLVLGKRWRKKRKLTNIKNSLMLIKEQSSWRLVSFCFVLHS